MSTLNLAKWATDLSPSQIPPSVLKAAQRSLYNYIGCTIGGCTHPTVQKARAALLPFSGPATSTLLGSTHISSSSSSLQKINKSDAQHASLLDGISSHVHDYDDTHLATIIHPTGPVASALLAFIEYQSSTRDIVISGEELLTALIAGIEVSCKLGLAVWPSHYDLGWHITSTTGSIGAAVAVGKILKLDAQQMAHAIGISATQVTGLREMFGSDTKSFHVGRATQNGLLGAVLAGQGFTSSMTALEAKRGWGNVVVGSGEPRLEGLLEELGTVWEVERNSFKPFPCGIVCHPAIDACIQLAREMRLRGEEYVAEIENVEMRVHPLVMELTAKRRPLDGLQAKFSVFHGCAVGLMYGKAGPAEYADEVVINPTVVALRDTIQATADENVQADEVFLKVFLKGGVVVEKHVLHAVGSVEVPMTDEQLGEKFLGQVELVVGSVQAREVSELAWKLGVVDDVARLIARL
uniref:Related to immune-responsive protein 1 n=1 Tax=Ramularia collo-cygni TaxID=112498 RepID=A0A2D3UUU0_9PEZI